MQEFQFSLRSLFLVTVAVSVWLGSAVVVMAYFGWWALFITFPVFLVLNLTIWTGDPLALILIGISFVVFFVASTAFAGRRIPLIGHFALVFPLSVFVGIVFASRTAMGQNMRIGKVTLITFIGWGGIAYALSVAP